MYNWRKMTLEERDSTLHHRRLQHLPWHSPPHFGGHELYLVSAANYEHAPILGRNPERLEAFEKSWLEAMQSSNSQIHAYCINPNHWHGLIGTLNLKCTLKSIAGLHGRTARQWNQEDRRLGRSVWHRCTDRFIRSEGHFCATRNYLHANPVRHGYVDEAHQWPFSSYSRFVEEVGIDEVRRLDRDFPLLDFGEGWDPPEL